MPDPEQILEDLLNKSRSTLGGASPRLLTKKPPVAAHGLRHGLTGQHTFLKDTDLIRYLEDGAEYIIEMLPIGIRENHLLQRIIDTDWRLGRIPFLQENLLRSSELREAKKIRSAHPETDEDTVEFYAQADSFPNVVNELEKLSRHETRLSRSLDLMHKEYERRQTARRQQTSHKFIYEDNKALVWYEEVLIVAKNLLKAREEVSEKVLIVEEEAAATEANETTSEKKLDCKNSIHLIHPLTEETKESLLRGHAFGLLTDLERTILAEMRAA